MITLTAAVGQSVLRNAIGRADNYITYEEKRIFDPSATGCYDCTRRAQSASACDHCPKKVYHTEMRKVYGNEKNRYGSMPSLNRGAILLLLYLHFCEPDENGLIRGFDASEAAEALSCHPRTIANNLTRLSDSGYAAVSHMDGIPGYYNVFLTGYSAYFRKAQENGRGYITLTQDLFHQILAQDTVNKVRLMVRSILTAQKDITDNRKGAEHPISEIRHQLPSYCRKQDILDILGTDSFRSVFRISEKKYTVRIAFQDAFDPVHVRAAMTRDYTEQVRRRLARYDQMDTSGQVRGFHASEKDIRDIAMIGFRYPVGAVLKAIDQIHDVYISQNLPIGSLGALVRTYTRWIAGFGDFSSAA